MTYTSIFEKILLILDIVSKSWVYIVFTLVAILLIFLLGLKKISKKTCFILISLATKAVLGYTVYIHYEPISELLNAIVDNIFLNIYFPSAYAYLFILMVINIVSIVSLLKPRGEKVYKMINGICFITTNFILTLILEIIAKDKVDIFTKESLFSNPNLITLLEFGVNIFIIWIISLIAVYIINILTERIIIARENKKLITEPVVAINTELSINETKLHEEYQETNDNNQPQIENPIQAIIPKSYQNKFIPNFTVETIEISEPSKPEITSTSPINNIEPTNDYINNYNTSYTYDSNAFDLSAFIPKKQDVKPISIVNNSVNTSQLFEQILNNELPVIKEEPKPISNIEETKNTYTLNDYRIFNKMLKDIREHNQSNSITIDKNLEYRLITKYSTETYNMFKTMLKIYSS